MTEPSTHTPTPTPSLPKPTDAEIGILRVLWRRGPSTVRQVLQALNAEQADRQIGYTTVLKLLQIMTDKGLVRRDASRRSHVYRAARARETTQRQLVDDLLTRAFAGSAARLAMQALRVGETSSEELAEIRTLLDSLEEGDG